MNRFAYPRFVWKSHRGFVTVCIAAVAAIQFVVIKLVSSVDTGPILAIMLEQLPEPFKALISEKLLVGLSLQGAAAFGFNHPVVLTLLVINALNIPLRHISGEIESGTLELLLAYPIRRTRFLFSLWFSASVALLLVICGAWAGSFSAIALAGDLTAHMFLQMLKIGLNLWLLLLFVMTVTLLTATFGKVGGRLGAQIAVATLLFYFLNFLSVFWQAIDFIKPFNVFTYYQPQELMFEQVSFGRNVAVLAVLTGACLLISLWQFKRRDIPG